MRRVIAGLAGLAALAALAGCGASHHPNKPRPPAPISIGASISDTRISVSPTDVSGGPATVLVTNQSSQPQRLRIESPSGDGISCIDSAASSATVNPRGTTSFNVDIGEGACTIAVDSAAIRPARLTVGARRESSSNDLLLP